MSYSCIDRVRAVRPNLSQPMQYARQLLRGDFALIRDRQEQLGFGAARMQIGKLEVVNECAPGRMS
jgi:hypothetical protein